VLLAIGSLAAVSYLRSSKQHPGATTEVLALFAPLLGALVQWGLAPLAASTAVVTTLLLTDGQQSNEAIQFGLWTLDLTNPLSALPQPLLDGNSPQGPLALAPFGNVLLYSTYEGQVPEPTDSSVPDDLAAPANCALAQVVYSFYLAKVGVGDHVIVQGAGGLGVLAAAVAKERGAASVTVIDGLDDRLALAKEFGADHLIDMKQHKTAEARIAQVKKLTEGWGADVVLEVVGKALAVPEGVEMLGNGGTYAMVGCICAGDLCSFDPASLVLPGKNVLGIMWYDAPSLLFSLDFLAKHKNKYPFHKLISHRYPLSAINEAFAAQDAGLAQRSALLPWS